jgi:nucleoside-diphosphate-sugar epimerase
MTASTVTVVGARGFIGSAIVTELQRRGSTVRTPGRGETLEGALGDVFYCAGITADFRTRPAAAVDAHASSIARIAEYCSFTSLLYLSSTRVYIHSNATSEKSPLVVEPADPDDLYGISKLLGEAVCLRLPKAAVRVARLSNVLGQNGRSTDFVYSLLRSARRDGRIVLQTALDSSKDYVAIDDAIDALLKISSGGRRRIYNVAAGVNTSHGEVVEAIAAATGAAYEVLPNAASVQFPLIDVTALRDEFGWNPKPAVPCIESLARSWVDELEEKRA